LTRKSRGLDKALSNLFIVRDSLGTTDRPSYLPRRQSLGFIRLNRNNMKDLSAEERADLLIETAQTKKRVAEVIIPAIAAHKAQVDEKLPEAIPLVDKTPTIKRLKDSLDQLEALGEYADKESKKIVAQDLEKAKKTAVIYFEKPAQQVEPEVKTAPTAIPAVEPEPEGGETPQAPSELKIPKGTQTQLYNAFVQNPQINRKALYAAIWGTNPEVEDDMNKLSASISKLNQALAAVNKKIVAEKGIYVLYENGVRVELPPVTSPTEGWSFDQDLKPYKELLALSLSGAEQIQPTGVVVEPEAPEEAETELPEIPTMPGIQPAIMTVVKSIWPTFGNPTKAMTSSKWAEASWPEDTDVEARKKRLFVYSSSAKTRVKETGLEIVKIPPPEGSPRGTESKYYIRETGSEETLAEMSRIEAEIVKLETYRPMIQTQVSNQVPGWAAQEEKLNSDIASKQGDLRKLRGQTTEVAF